MHLAKISCARITAREVAMANIWTRHSRLSRSTQIRLGTEVRIKFLLEKMASRLNPKDGDDHQE